MQVRTQRLEEMHSKFRSTANNKNVQKFKAQTLTDMCFSMISQRQIIPNPSAGSDIKIQAPREFSLVCLLILYSMHFWIFLSTFLLMFVFQHLYVLW